MRAFGHQRWTMTLHRYSFSGDKATGQATEKIRCSDDPSRTAQSLRARPPEL